MKSVTALILLAVFVQVPVRAQTEGPIPSPKHEFRSAWLTTAGAMDWPRGTTAAAQELSLRNIIRNMKAMGMNAVVFQAMPRGDAFYQSERLPWSMRLSGTVGQDPGWDPLAVAIEEAHRLGMELHAWYNVFRVGNIDMPDVADSDEPRHVYFENPEYVVTIDGNQLWLNPGMPEVRNWVIANVMEIVRNYDVDAIHFDFIRYGANGYPGDAELRDEQDPGMNLDAWRRESVSRFAIAAYDSVKAEKPRVKIGSAPFGHYDATGGWPAALSYYQYFQDSRRWLEEEKHDYLAPQVYWDIGTNCGPRFDWLVHDWVDNNFGRHIYIGTGPYQCGVLDELPQQIDSTRAIGAEGQMHFRYDIIAANPFGSRYGQPALVPSMGWMDQTEPTAPVDLSYRWLDDDTTVVEISWSDATATAEVTDPRRYAVYRVQSEEPPAVDEMILDPANLIAVTGETAFLDERSDRTNHYYVTSLSTNWIESTGGEIISVEGRLVSSERELPVAFELKQNYPNPFNPTTVIEYTVDRPGEVLLRVFNVLGQEVAVLEKGTMPAGSHTVRFDARDLASGTYFYVLEAGGRTAARAMMLLK
ncbi:MAG: family 10 glycosylhydrolase [Bacteroidota bacterium]